MCKQTKQRYSGCYCYSLLHDICAPHIEHTRMQIDNEPCPGLTHITSESMTRKCRSRMECVKKKDVFYTFENNGSLSGRDFKKKQELKKREERERREKEEREKKMSEREERDRQYWEEKRKKKVKKEKTENREVNKNDLQRWTGKVETADEDMNV